MKIFDILKQLANTSSKNEKEDIIREHKDNEIFKFILTATYDKVFRNYYVKKLPALDKEGGWTVDSQHNMTLIKSLLDKLAVRQLSGHAGLDAVKDAMEHFDRESQEVIAKIFDRDLKCGMSESTINKAIPNLIPTFDVALAKNFTDHEKKVTFDGSWFASRKMDGCRCIAICNGGDNIEFFSRKGKPFNTLNKLVPELKRLTENAATPVVFDGEICLINEDGKEDFAGIMKQIRKKDHTIENPMFKMFDGLTLSEFTNKESIEPLSTRLETLKGLYEEQEFNHISILEQTKLTEESFAELQKQSSDEGWEGLILRKDCKYSGKRTADLLKVKKFFDAEYAVWGIDKGPYTFTEAGKGQETIECMTAVKIMHKGHEVSVGSGFSKEERIRYYENPNEIISKVITVQYFETTINKKGTESLRFPTVKHIHGDVRDT